MNPNILTWYEWRWAQLFQGDHQLEPPILPASLREIFSIGDTAPSIQISPPHIATTLGWPSQSQFPLEVIRLYAVAGGSLDVPDLSMLEVINQTIFSLRRSESMKSDPSSREPFWGSLPEADYLSSLRTTFLNQNQPSSHLDHIVEYYDRAIRIVNKLQLSKGAKRAGAQAAIDRIFAALYDVDGVLGLFQRTHRVFLNEERACAAARNDVDLDAIQTKINARIVARMGRDWLQADALKAEIEAAGVVLNDSDTGTDWWLRTTNKD